MAACLVLAVAFGLRMMRHQPAPQEKTVAVGQPGLKENGGRDPSSSPGSPDEDSVLRATMAEITGDAAGDHRNCAINFRLLETPILLEEAGLKYDRAYLNLSDVVSARLAQLSDMRVAESHSCVFNGRRFAHVVLRNRGRLISLLVTGLPHPGDSGKAPQQALSEKERAVMACSQSDGFQIACFETARHAIFVVSDMPEGENLAVARLLATSVYNHVTLAERSV